MMAGTDLLHELLVDLLVIRRSVGGGVVVHLSSSVASLALQIHHPKRPGIFEALGLEPYTTGFWDAQTSFKRYLDVKGRGPQKLP